MLHLLNRRPNVAYSASAVMAFAPPLVQDSGSHLTTTGIVLVLGFLVLSLGIHEAAHGWVAWKRGDPTAKDLGRITLNPIPHIDPIMTIVLPATLYFLTHGQFIFGGAKPVPVNAMRLKHPLRDMVLVAIAGPGSNLVLGALFLVAWKSVMLTGSYTPDQVLPQVLEASMWVNIVLAVFNLMPVPPLDGSRVMTWLLPASLRPAYVGLERFGMVLVLVLLWIPGFKVFLWSGVTSAFHLIDAATGGAWSA